MFHHFPGETGVGRNCLVRSTDFTYTDERNRIYTFLSAVQQRGYKRQGGEGYLTKSLPPVEFTYTMPQIDGTVQTVDPTSLENLPDGLDGARYQWVDLDGEGVTGILTEQGGSWFYKRNLSPINRAATESEAVTASFAPIERVSQKPAMGIAAGSQFMDLAGDGQLDLVTLRGATPGFYERTRDGEDWESFRAFRSLPVLDWDNPNLRFIDLDGDGHSDILITEDDCFMWHRSLAEEGFGENEKAPQPWDEEKGPRVVFADATQSIYLADLSGDGLTDIVRLRNGEVCYWPNLGYGRFGTKVTMDNAPWFDAPDQFSQERIRLADIDGSGTTDILYLSAAGVKVYFNESGNRWADQQVLASFPEIDNLAAVTVVDLLGTGTACLVWSSPLPKNQRRSLRYIDLMGGEQRVEQIDGTELTLRGQKPHLLIQTRNNLGAETLVQYAPSTQFYLQDKLAGKPWITKLPFPVHVVEKVSVKDKWRQTTFSSTYSYHHGYFDGIEREFRGFGRVEQTDVEDFGTFTAGNSASPYIHIDDDAQTLYQPPIKTITWFHTGAFLDRARILSQFQTEYFSSDAFTEAALPEPDLATLDLSVEEWREALRACKGMMLRQEVYELDVDALANDEERRVKLFSTAFHNCHIQRLQARGEHRHAVFLVTESEAITYHYELDLRPDSIQPDPRIAHTLNLSIDEVGNVLESVAVAYPRLGRHTDSTLPAGTEDLIESVQQERHLVLTENRFTHDVIGDDAYRLRRPCEVKTYELAGINPETSVYYTLVELQAAVSRAALTEIPYHVVPDRTTPQKRRVEWVRMLYFSDDLETPLPFGQLNALALPYETYKLALTDDLLTAVFEPDHLTLEVRGNLDESDESGYLSGEPLRARFPDLVTDLETTEQYWVRSGVAGFAADAATHFYLPERYTDAFGHTTTLSYDSRDLYVESSTDPVGNMTRVRQFNFRVLTPAELEDINSNRSQMYFDVLGLPTAMARLGKGMEADSLSGFDDGLAHPDLADLTAFFNGGVYDEAQARQWLGNATARYVYHLGETAEADGTLTWGTQPAAACSIMREQHQAALDPGQISPLQVGFEYSDGMGTVLVQKVQAEPDPDDDSDNPPLRWIANGKTILNNKGNPVKQYEPYFSPSGHRFEEPMEVGVTAVIYYDAAGRQVRSEMPDGTYSRVEFSPWYMATWDANDTVRELGNTWYARRTDSTRDDFGDFGTAPNQRAARLAAVHANTPAVTHLDSLGREVIAVAHNKSPSDDREHRSQPLLERPWIDEKYVTFTKLDIEGKPLWIQDARGNRVMEYINAPGAEVGFVPGYDIAGNMLFQHSMDGGDRWMLMDATGQPFYAWDVNERVLEDGTSVLEQRRFHTVYDRLRRPVEQQLEVNGGAVQVVERLVYGDEVGLFLERPADAIPEAQERNLRGQVYHHYDPSGVMTSQRFDFKGNLLVATRRLAADYQAAMLHWPENPPERMFESETFIQRTQYDALNRMAQQANWHRADRDAPLPAIYTPQYNQRGVLMSEQLTVRGAVTQAIEHIAYDAKGQRLRIDYGNNTTTTYTYDPETFQLTHLQTTRTGGSRRYQDLHYTYDPVGNIAEIRDDANELVFFNSQIVRPRNRYTYDALYRLIEAEGREQYSNSGAPPQKLPNAPDVTFPINSPTDPNALRNYTQRYRYDAVGNIMRMEHQAGDSGSWTRHYEYATDSNRLLRTWQGGDRLNAVEYGYDTHGSMLNLANTPDAYRLRWDYRDMIHQVNLGGGGQAFYAYDAEKQRTRKRIEHLGENRIEERLYIGGMELYRRWLNGLLVEEIETHHLFADDQRILIVEDVLETDNSDLSTRVLFRYQYGNHLGSVGLEMTGDSTNPQVISYEEYHPYGTTAYQAKNRAVRAVAKRYRYTGMERDEETGLSYHTARFYLPWLGRWLSADPLDIVAGVNLYRYVGNDPVNYKDSTGRQQTSNDFDPTDPNNFSTFESYQAANSQQPEAVVRQVWDEAHSTPQPQTFERCEGCHPTPSHVQRDLNHYYERNIDLNGDGVLYSLADLDRAFGPPAPPSPGFVENIETAWEQGDNADRTVIVATGVGTVSGVVPYFGDYVSLGASAVVFGADPSLETLGDLGLDAAGAALPYVPAVGTLRRIERLDDAVDLVNSSRRPVITYLEPGPPPRQVSARPSGRSPRTSRDEAVLTEQGISTRSTYRTFEEDHHLFVQRRRDWFRARDLDIDQFTVRITWGDHNAIHTVGPNGGLNWNDRWNEFIDANRDASRMEVIEQMRRMRQEFDLENVPLQQYRAGRER